MKNLLVLLMLVFSCLVYSQEKPKAPASSEIHTRKGQEEWQEYYNDLEIWRDFKDERNKRLTEKGWNPKPNYSAGDELLLFRKNFYIGYATTVGGGAIILGNVLLHTYGPGMSIDSETYMPLNVIGGIVSFVGGIVMLESVNHAGKAGLLLNQNGVGFKIPIK